MGVDWIDREVLKRVGERIAAARHAAGITQAELAERASIEPTTLSRYETGARSPSLPTLVALAGALNIDPGALLAAEPGSRALPSPVQQAVSLLADLDADDLDRAIRVLRELVR